MPAEVRQLLTRLIDGQRDILTADLVGVYLRGSLAVGDFDSDTSDVDFFAVTEHPLTGAQFAALVALHARLDTLPNRYAAKLEGPYLDRSAARRWVPGQHFPTIARGEPLALAEHGANWLLERWVVREHGIALLGPNARFLIDPVSTSELRKAVRLRLRDWDAWAENTDSPDWRLPLNHTAYVIQTMCRALHALATGQLSSKPQALAWALANLPEPWRTLVARATTWRTDTTTVDLSVIPEVQAFVHWTAAHVDAVT